MTVGLNAMRWDGSPGHYEVWYVSMTDRGSGVGLWIRYTLLAPVAGAPSASLWLMAMEPRRSSSIVIAHRESFPIDALAHAADPFELMIAGAKLTDRGMRGAFGEVSWDLAWDSSPASYQHVDPLLRRSGMARTVLTLPHPDLAPQGTVDVRGRELRLRDARGGQAHLWGSKHAARWNWAHANAFETLAGEPAPGDFFDGVSVFVPRAGREIGPATPVLGRFSGQNFISTNPARVLLNRSRVGLSGWRVDAIDGARRLEVDVDAPRESLVGVTYLDPDGERAYCYNSEIASMRVHVWERSKAHHGWTPVQTLVAPGRAHFEYAQREPVPGLRLHVT